MYHFVEEKIKEAVDNGEFDNLPGKGKPLNLKELEGLSPELRMSYTMLKNAGYLDEDSDKKRKNLKMDDLMRAATGTREISTEERKRKWEVDEFVHNQKLHRNKKFAAYAKRIYEKLFGGAGRGA